MDDNTNKMILSLQSLQDYADDKLHFVGLIEDETMYSQQCVVWISQKPIYIQNGISYFLLKAHTCQIDALRIVYILSHSLYIQSKFMIEMQIKIQKSVDIEGAWNHINYLYILTNAPQTLSGIKTSAQTKQMVYRESKDVFYQKQIAISQNLSSYFTQTYTITTRNTLYDIQTLKLNLKHQSHGYHAINNQNNYYFVYEGLVDAFNRQIMSSKPLKVKYFLDCNISIICQQLVSEVIQNYDMFESEIIQNKQKMQDINQSVKNIKKQALRPLQSAKKINWLKITKKFKHKQKQVKNYLQQKANRLIQMLNLTAYKESIRIIDQQKSRDLTKMVGNQRFDGMNLQFCVYRKNIQGQVNPLFRHLLKEKWREEGKTIKTNKQLLQNLQTRLEINHNKKKGLEMAIGLAQKQYKALMQLPLSNINKKF